MRVLVLGAIALGCSANAFPCEADADCAGAATGACEASGWCSFPDDGCESGRRYGRWAGDGIGDQCVPIGDTTSSTDAGADSTTVATFTTSDSTGPLSATLPATASIDSGESTSPIDPGSTSTVDPTDSGTTGEPLDPDLVAWYRFDEGDFAGMLLDEVGNHHGVCTDVGCPTAIPGPVGSAGEFDGIDDIVHIASDADLQVGDALTVALWVRIDAADGLFQSFVAKAYLAENADTYEIGLDGGGNVQFGLSTVVPPDPELQVVPELGVWFHVAGTWDGAAMRMYVDGALVGELDVGPLAQDEHGVTIGGGVDFGLDENFLDGAIDDVRIYRRALLDDEIAALVMP
jgi:hypothetical protein